MGYTTKFTGHIALSRPLTVSEAKSLLEYSDDPEKIPGDHPNSYLQWVPSQTMDAILWDQGEKFYDHIEWLEWICDWLKDHGIVTNGQLNWSGEQGDDFGSISVTDGVITSKSGEVVERADHKPLTMKGLALMALEQVTATNHKE